MGPIINNINPDLHAFRANGGKLIQYHGWADPDISPLNSINYYQSVVQFLNRDGHGSSETKSFYRLFMVPGMFHCNGGPGPNTFDALGALEQWKEKGTAPDRIVASHVTNGPWIVRVRCARIRRKRSGRARAARIRRRISSARCRKFLRVP